MPHEILNLFLAVAVSVEIYSNVSATVMAKRWICRDCKMA